MGKMSPHQLCEFYLDGNDEAAFEVFENCGPAELRKFLGHKGPDSEWLMLYNILLDEYGFLEKLSRKYQPFISDLIFERGVEIFRSVFQIEDRMFDHLVARVWESLLDSRLESTMKGMYIARRKSHFGSFFFGLRSLLRGELDGF